MTCQILHRPTNKRKEFMLTLIQECFAQNNFVAFWKMYYKTLEILAEWVSMQIFNEPQPLWNTLHFALRVCYSCMQKILIHQNFHRRFCGTAALPGRRRGVQRKNKCREWQRQHCSELWKGLGYYRKNSWSGISKDRKCFFRGNGGVEHGILLTDVNADIVYVLTNNDTKRSIDAFQKVKLPINSKIVRKNIFGTTIVHGWFYLLVVGSR